MKNTISVWLILLVAAPLLAQEAPAGDPLPAAASVDNRRLASLYQEDQADRRGEINWSKVSQRDAERREEVLSMLGKGEIRTANDFRHAAMVFQHGSSVEDARLAYSLAWISVTLDSSNKSARWLSAAAWDRLLMRQGQPQWYGTQYTKTSPEAAWDLHEIDESAVTDEERQEMGVPTLAESKERVKTMNSEE